MSSVGVCTSNRDGQSTNQSTNTLTFPAGTQPGDTIDCCFNVNGGIAITSILCGANDWSGDIQHGGPVIVAANNQMAHYIHRLTPAEVATGSVTLTWVSTGRLSASGQVWRGVGSFRTTWVTTTATNVNAPTIIERNEWSDVSLLATARGLSTVVTITVGTGFTSDAQNSSNFAGAVVNMTSATGHLNTTVPAGTSVGGQNVATGGGASSVIVAITEFDTQVRPWPPQQSPGGFWQRLFRRQQTAPPPAPAADTTPVTPATRATSWDTLASVTATRATTWNVASSVAQTKATTWNILAGVTPATRATTWQVLGNVTGTRATTWNVAATVTGTRSTTWNVAATVTGTRATTWAVLAGVTPATRATTWTVLASVTGTRATTWTVAAIVTGTRATTWTVRAQVAQTKATSWNTLAAKAATRATFWDVKAAIVATRTTTWNVLAGVEHDVQLHATLAPRNTTAGIAPRDTAAAVAGRDTSASVGPDQHALTTLAGRGRTANLGAQP